MDIIVPKDDFKNAISLARKALSAVVIQEERGHLLFIVRGPKMIVQGTNNDLKARCTIDIANSSGEDFAFTADPKVLEKLASKVEVKDININFDKDTLIVKVYTTDTKKSFGTLQSFPPEKMLTFEEHLKTERAEYPVKKEALLFALKYAMNFLADKKEDQKQFDFVVINSGIVYAANGFNKLGIIVFKTFANIPGMKIRKLVLPLYMTFAKGLDGVDVKLTETDKDIGLESIDGKHYFSFLKSTLEAPNIPKEHLKSEGPFTLIDKSRLLKVAERAIITNSSAATVGLELTLSGSGDSSNLELKLVSNRVAVETVSCARMNDDGGETISHILDFRMLKAVLNSFNAKEDIRLHINDKGRFFKVYSKGDVEGEVYVLAGVGAYAKIVSQ
jgi:DNA polymerase III sliding clamp (beta) subunit (PCNA family)